MSILGLNEIRRPLLRRCFGLALAGVSLGVVATVELRPVAANANGETRTLTLRNQRNDELLTSTYKRNGEFDSEQLQKLSWFMRDWRQNEQKEMDPKLFDILWELHRHLGSKQPIHLVSGYRSQKTNSMLRRRSRGVARQSRHMTGQAADVFFPDVSTKSLREVALVMQRGGVGYYPHAGKYGFVHVDTGSVRHWPRMNPVALAQLFKRRDLLTNRRRGAGAPTQLANLGGAAKRPAARGNPPLSIASLITNDRTFANRAAPVPNAKPPIIVAGLAPRALPAPVPLIKPAAIRRRNFAAIPPVPLRKPIITAKLQPASATPPLVPLAGWSQDEPAKRSNLLLARREGLRRFVAPVSTRHAKGDRLDTANARVVANLDARKYAAPVRRTTVNRAAKGNMLMSFQVRPKPRRNTKSDRTTSHNSSAIPAMRQATLATN